MAETLPSHDSQSLAKLLGVLLCLPQDGRVFATPNFRPWLAANDSPVWPPPSGSGGLWLVDTGDREGAALIDNWAEFTSTQRVDAALVLATSRSIGFWVRRLLRQTRGPGLRRLSTEAVQESVTRSSALRSVTELGFDNGPDVPKTFHVTSALDTNGTGFLLTKRPPFQNALWDFVRVKLDVQCDAAVTRLHLRDRGAAVAILRDNTKGYVVRLVADPDMQRTVLRNHTALVSMRQILNKRGSTLLGLLPEPLFAERYRSTLVLGETHMPGVLAWKVASGSLGDVIYAQAVDFLEGLKRATTLRSVPVARRLGIISTDRRRLDAAPFVSEEMRKYLLDELRRAEMLLRDHLSDLCASHGDFGYGNILVEEQSGRFEGVIDWDTARPIDVPGVDRVNLEIQIARGTDGVSFPAAVERVWKQRRVHEALADCGQARTVFGLGVSRFVFRALRYPAIYAQNARHFAEAMRWLANQP